MTKNLIAGFRFKRPDEKNLDKPVEQGSRVTLRDVLNYKQILEGLCASNPKTTEEKSKSEYVFNIDNRFSWDLRKQKFWELELDSGKVREVKKSSFKYPHTSTLAKKILHALNDIDENQTIKFKKGRDRTAIKVIGEDDYIFLTSCTRIFHVNFLDPRLNIDISGDPDYFGLDITICELPSRDLLYHIVAGDTISYTEPFYLFGAGTIKPDGKVYEIIPITGENLFTLGI